MLNASQQGIKEYLYFNDSGMVAIQTETGAIKYRLQLNPDGTLDLNRSTNNWDSWNSINIAKFDDAT